MSEILVNIAKVSPASSSGSWATITDMSIGSITVQSTSSVLLLMFQMQIDPATDSCAEFRFYVNGSEVGSPVLTGWADNAGGDEAQGITMVWAIDGLSGSSNTFAVQWRTLQGSPIADTTRIRTLQIVELEGSNAEILVDDSASNQIGDPSSWADLFTANTIPVAGTGSVLIMIANVPFNLEGDEMTDFSFAVDSTREGAVTSVYTDEVNGGCGWCGVHCLDGLSTGNHSFHLEWQTVSGAGQTRAVLRTFQVVEITAQATLELELLGNTTGQSAPGSYADVTDLSDSYVVSATDAIHLLFANVQIVAASDRTADFRIGVDGTEEGAELLTFTDGTAIAGNICLAMARTGLSEASHSFSARWQDSTGTPALDTSKNRTFFAIELTQTPQVTYKLEGITKDKTGSVLVSCEVYLLKDNGDSTYSFIAYVQSNGATGAYSFTGLSDGSSVYQVVAWKDDTPHVMDVTDNVLVPVEE